MYLIIKIFTYICLYGFYLGILIANQYLASLKCSLHENVKNLSLNLTALFHHK